MTNIKPVPKKESPLVESPLVKLQESSLLKRLLDQAFQKPEAQDKVSYLYHEGSAEEVRDAIAVLGNFEKTEVCHRNGSMIGCGWEFIFPIRNRVGLKFSVVPTSETNPWFQVKTVLTGSPKSLR